MYSICSARSVICSPLWHHMVRTTSVSKLTCDIGRTITRMSDRFHAESTLAWQLFSHGAVKCLVNTLPSPLDFYNSLQCGVMLQ